MQAGLLNIARYLRKIVAKNGKGFTRKGQGLTQKAFSSKYLLVTNVGISITLSGVGDVLQQNYEIMKKEIPTWDPIRTRNMSVSGCTVGILCHYWYKLLDTKLPGRTLKIVTKKVILDQIICSPFAISVFFITLAVLEQTSKQDFIVEATEKGWRLYVADWLVWPPAQFLNFYIIPSKYRVFYDNTISLGYDVYTSYVKYDKS